MSNKDDQKRQIVEGAQTLLQKKGPAFPSYSQIAESSETSRQLVRYYFDTPEDLMCDTCDLLAEAYRMALIDGVQTLEGPNRLRFIFDFYFDLVDEVPKPRDDQCYDAVLAFAARSERVKTKLRAQYTLVGQLLQLEIKMQYPSLELEDCAEISYLFVCLMYGHWKMVASLGCAENHKMISRRAIDRIIASYVSNDVEKLETVRVWETK